MAVKEKIAVLGGTGFLGKNVVQVLSQGDKYEVSSCSRRTGVDIRDYSKIEEFLKAGFDTVINCAAHVGGIAYNEMKPIEVFEDNVQIGMNVVKACAKTGVKYLINIMPNCTYPGHLDLYEEEKWWDGAIHESVLTYGLPRKMMWGLCQAYIKKYDIKFIHIIFPNMYGPDDYFDPVQSHALGALIHKIVEAKKKEYSFVDIWGTGRPVREWLYVKDAALSITRVLENRDNFVNNDIVNVGNGTGVSIKEIAYIIKEIVGWNGEFVFDISRKDGAMCKIFRNEKMERLLQWRPPTPLRDGIKETIEWYLKNHG
ncbi:MAG: NAD-dependent epimerase/dehydratase family protein [Nitrospirota bacterium]|nr:NAD-dependent epimerase/dehydratase family protein [Nitrospirota bacterium]